MTRCRRRQSSPPRPWSSSSWPTPPGSGCSMPCSARSGRSTSSQRWSRRNRPPSPSTWPSFGSPTSSRPAARATARHYSLANDHVERLVREATVRSGPPRRRGQPSHRRVRGLMPGHHDHGHEHPHGHDHPGGLRDVVTGIFRPHSHDAADFDDVASSERGIRRCASRSSRCSSLRSCNSWVGATGSVALLADTIHNFSDALTAVPLFLAFRPSRRPPTAATPTATAALKTWPASS